MSDYTYQPHHASLRILLAVFVFGAMLMAGRTTASAQPCMPGTCTAVDMYNCGLPAMGYDVEFLMCCNGMQVVAPVIHVPPMAPPPPPAPCPPSGTYGGIPPGCTIIGVWNIMPPPPNGYNFDPVNCTLEIF